MDYLQSSATIEQCLEAFGINGLHPAADLFPMIVDEDFVGLCESVALNGLEQKIVLTHDNRLLDGRNRLKACFLTGKAPSFERKSEQHSDDYVGLALRLNLERRHLSAGQRAALAVDIERVYAEQAKERQIEAGKQYGRGEKVRAKLPQPINSKPLPKARDLAAEKVQVASRYVQDAKRIKDEAPDVFEQVKSGQLNIPQAKKEIQNRKAFNDKHWTESQIERKEKVLKGLTVVASKRSGDNGSAVDAALIDWANQQGLAVEIGRNTDWGNPFEMPVDGDRDTVCDNYENHYVPYKPSLFKKISHLKGKVLICWCYPNRCHGDHLSYLANKEK